MQERPLFIPQCARCARLTYAVSYPGPRNPVRYVRYHTLRRFLQRTMPREYKKNQRGYQEYRGASRAAALDHAQHSYARIAARGNDMAPHPDIWCTIQYARPCVAKPAYNQNDLRRSFHVPPTYHRPASIK